MHMTFLHSPFIPLIPVTPTTSAAPAVSTTPLTLEAIATILVPSAMLGESVITVAMSTHVTSTIRTPKASLPLTAGK